MGDGYVILKHLRGRAWRGGFIDMHDVCDFGNLGGFSGLLTAWREIEPISKLLSIDMFWKATSRVQLLEEIVKYLDMFGESCSNP